MASELVLVELGVVIVGLAMVARLGGRFGFSPIPLYLLAGLAFGEGGVLPLVTSEEFIEVGAEIGVVLLLFMLGLEYSPQELVANLARRGGDHVLNVILNFGPGFVAGLLLGWRPVAAMFLGGVTYLASSGIVAKLLEDLGWVGNRETPVVLSLLVAEDLVMAAYLPVMAVLVEGETVMEGAVSVGVALAAVGLVLAVALRFGDPISRVVFSHSDEVLLLTIFGITLLVAGIAETLQVSAAVGAFLVGIMVSGPSADRARELLRPLRDLFGAVFFVFFGLRIDPGLLPGVLPVAAALAAVSAMSKGFVGWFSARRAGIARRGRIRAGSLLIARGEFSIAIAGIAVTAGVEPRLAPLAAAYVLVLAIAGPVVAKVADRVVAAPGRGDHPRERLA